MAKSYKELSHELNNILSASDKAKLKEVVTSLIEEAKEELSVCQEENFKKLQGGIFYLRKILGDVTK